MCTGLANGSVCTKAHLEVSMRSHGRTVIFLAAIAVGGGACSSSNDTSGGAQDSSTGDTGVADSAHGDSTTDSSSTDTTPDSSPPLDAAGGACGDKTCGAGQICKRQYT